MKNGGGGGSESSSRAGTATAAGGAGEPLMEKIAKNKYITEKDVAREREEERERKRVIKMKEVDNELIKQNE